MFNPRLASGDVGVGLSIRRMRDNFLSAFTTTYSLRPIADVGSVFRRYPGMWMVFVQDGEVQGRYKLIAERLSRPGASSLGMHCKLCAFLYSAAGSLINQRFDALSTPQC